MSFLVDSTIKVSLILLAALCATLLLRHRSAAARHWVLAVAIACAAAVPILGLLVPSWHVDWAAFDPARPVAQTESVVSTTRVLQEPVAAAGATVPAPAAAAPGAAAFTFPALLALAWTGGAAISLLILAAGLARLKWVAAKARRVDAGRWPGLAAEVSTALGLRREVVLLQSGHPTLLGTWGVARPKVLLPSAARDWPTERARIVLSHELAHIQRGDWAVQIAAEVLRSVYWFNPLAWIACGRLRQESEHACDDAVLSAGVNGADYASHLLEIARTLSGQPRVLLPASAMARPSSLKGRISAMLNTRVNRRPLSPSARTATVIALLILTVSIAGFAAQNFFTFSGLVIDSTNRMMPGVTLTVTNAASQAKHEVKSDATGRFEFVGLPPGEYSLTARLPGFATYTDKFAIIGRNLDRTIQLTVGALEETITVVGAPTGQQLIAEALVLRERRQRVDERRRAVLDKCTPDSVGAAGGKIVPPLRLTNANPVYPENLSNANGGGTVIMDAVIGADGDIQEVHAVESPHPDLASAAMEAVRQWQYTPTLLNCVPIEVRMRVTTNFRSPQ